MTLDELRALLTPDRLDEIAAHNCGASLLALALASELTDALTERDALRASAVASELRAIRADLSEGEARAEVARLTALLPTAEELESLTAVIDQAWVYDRAIARGWLSRVSKGGE